MNPQDLLNLDLQVLKQLPIEDTIDILWKVIGVMIQERAELKAANKDLSSQLRDSKAQITLLLSEIEDLRGDGIVREMESLRSALETMRGF